MADEAELIKVADGIVAELKAAQVAGQFIGVASFTPERSYADWADELDTMDDLRVDGVPIGYDEVELETPVSVAYLCRSHIGVRFKFPRSESEGANNRIKKATIDRLVLFVQEIDSLLRKEQHRRLTSFQDASWQEGKIVSTYSRAYLRDKRMFFGLLRVSYAVSKD